MTLPKAASPGGVSMEDLGRRFIWVLTILVVLSIPAVVIVNQSVDDARYLWVLLSPVVVATVNITLLVRHQYRVDISLGALAVTAAVSHTLFGVHATDLTTAVVLVMAGSIIALYAGNRRTTFVIGYSAFLAILALYWGRVDGGGALNALSMVGSFSLATYFLTQLMRIAQDSNAEISHYRAILNEMPIAIFEDDFTGLIAELDRLKANGIVDIREYLNENPSEVDRLMSLITVLDANERAASMLGTTRAGSIGQLQPIETEGRNFESYLSELEAIWNNQAEIDNEVLVRADPDVVGSVKWLGRSAERTGRTFVAIADISDLVQARDTLADLNRSKDEFVAAISHELRTPLTAVLGFATELANNTEMGEHERSDLMDLIVEQSKEMAYIVEDLLVSARADMGALAVAPAPSNLPSLVRETLTELGQRIRVDHPGDVIGYVDPVRFRQIIRNLVTNAQRYGGKNRWIEIIQDPDFASVMVSDDGPGVPANMAEKIFDSFVTAHEPKAVTASMGLGLSVSRHLAALMGGTLVYRAAPDGSKFILTVPTKNHSESEASMADTPIQTT